MAILFLSHRQIQRNFYCSLNISGVNSGKTKLAYYSATLWLIFTKFGTLLYSHCTHMKHWKAGSKLDVLLKHFIILSLERCYLQQERRITLASLSPSEEETETCLLLRSSSLLLMRMNLTRRGIATVIDERLFATASTRPLTDFTVFLNC